MSSPKYEKTSVSLRSDKHRVGEILKNQNLMAHSHCSLSSPIPQLMVTEYRKRK